MLLLSRLWETLERALTRLLCEEVEDESRFISPRTPSLRFCFILRELSKTVSSVSLRRFLRGLRMALNLRW